MNPLDQGFRLVFGTVCFLSVFNVGLGLPARTGVDQGTHGEGPRLQSVSLINVTRTRDTALLGSDLVRDLLLLDLRGTGLYEDTEFRLTTDTAECDIPRQQDGTLLRDTAIAATTGPSTSTSSGTTFRTLRWLDVTHNLTTTRFFVCASQVVSASGGASASTKGNERTSHPEIKWIHQGTSVVLYLPCSESVKTGNQDIVAGGTPCGGQPPFNGTR